MGLELWSKLIFGGLRYFTGNDNGKAALHRMVIWQCDNFGVKVRSLPYSSSPPFDNDKFKMYWKKTTRRIGSDISFST